MVALIITTICFLGACLAVIITLAKIQKDL